jgi:hypothetical protein
MEAQGAAAAEQKRNLTPIRNDSFETTDKREVRGRRGEVRRKSGTRNDEVFFFCVLCASAPLRLITPLNLTLHSSLRPSHRSVFIRVHPWLTPFFNCMVPA